MINKDVIVNFALEGVKYVSVRRFSIGEMGGGREKREKREGN